MTEEKKSLWEAAKDMGEDALDKAEFAAHEQLDIVFFRRHMGFNDSRQGTLVGNGNGRITQLCRALHQFLRVRGAAQEAEVAEAV